MGLLQQVRLGKKKNRKIENAFYLYMKYKSNNIKVVFNISFISSLKGMCVCTRIDKCDFEVGVTGNRRLTNWTESFHKVEINYILIRLTIIDMQKKHMMYI